MVQSPVLWVMYSIGLRRTYGGGSPLRVACQHYHSRMPSGTRASRNNAALVHRLERNLL